MHLGDAATELGPRLHLRQQVRQEHHLPVARPGDEAILRVPAVLDNDNTKMLDPTPSCRARGGVEASEH